MLYAIKHKRTDRLLVANAEKEERCYSYESPYTAPYIQVRESRYGGTIFVTDSKKIAHTLAKTGKWSDDIRLDTGHGETKIDLKDLAVVRLIQKKKTPKKKVTS